MNNEETIFALETANQTIYIDYFPDSKNAYSVFYSEKYYRSYATFGEALEAIFKSQRGIDFYTKEAVNQMKKSDNDSPIHPIFQQTLKSFGMK
jgi:hypothetical protein